LFDNHPFVSLIANKGIGGLVSETRIAAISLLSIATPQWPD
jgi:hypothetical protein